MPPTLADRVRHILEAIANIERVLAGKTAQEFGEDYLLRLLVERLLEIICEASRHVPENAKAREPDIPWQDIIDFGNRLRHAYHSLDPAIVWRIVTEDLPPLKAFVERVIREEEGRAK